MIPVGLTPEYRSAYNRPHRPIFRVEVWNNVEQVGEITEILAGDVKCGLTSQITRRGSLSVPGSMMPRTESDLLAPFGNRLHLYRGIEVGGVEYLLRVFTGLIMKASRKPRQPCIVEFADRAAEVDENDFEAAEETISDHTIVEEIVRLIREGVPGATFGTHSPLNVEAGPQVFDDSRSQACDQLAAAGGAFWYARATGEFVVRRVPWAYQEQGVAVQPVVRYTDQLGPVGESTGTISDYGAAMSREDVYNVVVGVSDQADGEEPLRAAVRDTNTSSPTFIGGKFGRRVLKVDLPSAGGGAAVYHGAETMRRRSRASAEALPWEMIPDPSLELGDVARVDVMGRKMLRVVSEFNVPMTEAGVMTCVGRPIVLPDGTLVPDMID